MTDNQLANLRQQIVTHFNESELRRLAFDLGVEYELLNGQNRGDKTIELISYMQRHNRLPELLDAVHQHLSQMTQPNRSDNPLPLPPDDPFFIGGRINDPRYFFGRERLLREIRTELRKHSSVSVVGDAQMGKSSLLYYLYLTRNAWLPDDVTLAYVDLQGVLDEADFCETVLAKLGAAGETLRDLKRVLYRQDVILLFDEVERIAEPDFNPRLHDLLRALAQEPHFAMCLVTQRSLDAVFPPQTPGGVSPFHNIFSVKRLGPFTVEEARRFLQQRGAGFSEAEVEELLAQSGGHPARLQRLARQLFVAKRG
ncbi:MAG: AAA family ATPase [Chloroflexota bacterium]